MTGVVHVHEIARRDGQGGRQDVGDHPRWEHRRSPRRVRMEKKNAAKSDDAFYVTKNQLSSSFDRERERKKERKKDYAHEHARAVVVVVVGDARRRRWRCSRRTGCSVR